VTRLADVVREHGASYLHRFGSSVLPAHRRALLDIEACRTGARGAHRARCVQCEAEHLLFHSCRNRACPQCGYDATTRWIQSQEKLLLPVTYFHVVFTLPSELRRIVRSYQRLLLPLFFRAAFRSLEALCRDPRYLGAEIGALAVLHTWTRSLEWHPHIHMLVPEGGIAPDGSTFLRVPRRKARGRGKPARLSPPYLVPQYALAEGFRRRFLVLARRAMKKLGVRIPPVPSKKRWVVYAKPAVQGAEKVLAYLGRYVHRTALSDKAILSSPTSSTITFRYR
jgi:hypothetical protein